MNFIELTIIVLYFGILGLLALFGVHRYLLVYLFYKHRSNARNLPDKPDLWPFVTVQLPLYNEMYVAQRLIDAVCRFDYPKDRFEVQVLDDSDDETALICKAAVQRWQQAGIDIVHRRRKQRTGYKAGALAEGLPAAKGELVAIFDADFVPSPDFLKQTIPHFRDNRVGMVQSRWEHLNRAYSNLTETQAIMLDAHFVIEHAARNYSGRFFNFNGTAGVWRAEAIRSAGGWQHDTLTEDLDLSYRAQMAGWDFVYLQGVTSPAELPVEMDAFRSQQQRWSKGGIQTARKLMGPIFRSSLAFSVKAEAFFHLAANFAYVLMFLLSLLMPLSVFIRYGEHRTIGLLLEAPLFLLAMASIAIFYLAAQREGKRDLGRAAWRVPLVFAVGMGMSFSNSIAVVEALLHRESPFVRTPKYALESDEQTPRTLLYRPLENRLALFELAVGIYYALSIAYAFFVAHTALMAFPFLLLVGSGYFYVGGLSLIQSRAAARPLPLNA